MSYSNIIFLKDVKSEFRTRVSFNTQLLFTITTLSIILFAVGNESISIPTTISFYWIVSIFAAMSGLSRVFVKEEERGTFLFLFQLASSQSVFIGKLLFNAIFTILVNFFILILFSLFIDTFSANLFFILVMILGSIGIASVSTIVAAIISKVNSSTTLYTVLSFPILIPLLMTLIQASQLSIEGAFFSEMRGHFSFMIGYNISLILISLYLITYLWSE
ncbi:MAG: heme exporter protein CcmB [Bacteroidota bacterium]